MSETNLKAGNTTKTLEPVNTLLQRLTNEDVSAIVNNLVEDEPLFSFRNESIREPEFDPGDVTPRTLLLDRIEKLEERVDAILDRIALYNVRSQHRL